MSVSLHLAVEPRDYDERIRQLIPLYDELIPEVAGALAQACLKAVPAARVLRPRPAQTL